MVVMVFPDPPVAPVTKVWVMPNLMELPVQAVAKLQQYVDRGSAELHYARKMFEAGALKIEPPQNIAAFLADIRLTHHEARRTNALALILRFGERLAERVAASAENARPGIST